MYNETTDVAKVNKEGNSWDLVQTGFEDFFFFRARDSCGGWVLEVTETLLWISYKKYVSIAQNLKPDKQSKATPNARTNYCLGKAVLAVLYNDSL